MSKYNNSAKIFTGSTGGELRISLNNTKQTIFATNNKAQYYAELAEKYKNEAKEHRDNAQYYAEQNSDVTFEYIDSVKESLEEQIATKQDNGDYALKSELPTKVSELQNDLEYTSFDAVIPNQKDNENKVLCTDGEKLFWNTNSSYKLFDTKVFDYILDFGESQGWALQGTYVYKEAVIGSHYGYSDFYNKVLEEFNEATNIETINGVEIKVHFNGHKFYDISNKSSIDNYFNSIGTAWFYGVDIENERVFLPRDNYFSIKGTVPVAGDGKTLGLTNGSGGLYGVGGDNVSGQFTLSPYSSAYDKTLPVGGIGTTGNSETQGNGLGVTTDASKSGIEGKLIPNQEKYLYICVGNTTSYEGMTEVVNQGMEILEQVAQKVNVDGTNLNTEGKSLISGFSMPSNRYIDLTLGASGSTYAAPANGWFCLGGGSSSGNKYVELSNNGLISGGISISGLRNAFVIMPANKGDVIGASYNIDIFDKFRFYYAEGEV